MTVEALDRWNHRQEIRDSLERFDRIMRERRVRVIATGEILVVLPAALERARTLRTREQLVNRLAEVEGD